MGNKVGGGTKRSRNEPDESPKRPENALRHADIQAVSRVSDGASLLAAPIPFGSLASCVIRPCVVVRGNQDVVPQLKVLQQPIEGHRIV